MYPPLVKCLMVTQPGRTEMFKLAVRDFTQQRHTARQLVIVTKYPDYEMVEEQNFVRNLLPGPERLRIFWQHVSDVGASLGALRNAAIEYQTGVDPQYCCVWDDDDRNHPDRLSAQLQVLQTHKAVASYLAAQLYYFADLRKLFVVNWGRRQCPGTLLFRADTAARYEPVRRLEGADFLRKLLREGAVTGVHDRAELYLRVVHPQTTMPVGHHRQFAATNAWPQPQVLARQKWLEQLVRSYRLQGPVRVCGLRGEAFVCN